MIDVAILLFTFWLGAYFCSVELHRRFLGTWVERVLQREWNGELFRLLCFSIGCKLTFAVMLVVLLLFSPFL